MAARIGLAVAALAVGVTACEDGGDGNNRAEPEAIATTFVGTAEGGGTYVAIVVDAEGDALAYATDGAQSVDWVDGVVVRDETGRLSNDGGAVLEVSLTRDVATGTFARPGFAPLPFRAAKATAPAGLYRASEFFADGDYVAGWIVLPDGTRRGAVRRYETPLPLGSVDATTFRPGDETFTVPGGELRPRRFDASADV